MSKFIIAIAVAAVMFGLQSRLIRATDRKVLQLIPVFLLAAAYITALAMFILDRAGMGGAYFNWVYALIISAVTTAALIGDGVAWLYEKV